MEATSRVLDLDPAAPRSSAGRASVEIANESPARQDCVNFIFIRNERERNDLFKKRMEETGPAGWVKKRVDGTTLWHITSGCSRRYIYEVASTILAVPKRS